ncbi:MAG: glucose-6-phosphate dehydrogenase [Cellvibrionales bacterium]|nr:glucose-6-phosphate dehydrogenase [Cellvibrionales bacterium]
MLVLIVGGEGDLAYRKLYPALFELDRGGHLPAPLRVVGIARHEVTQDEFAERVQRGVVADLAEAGTELKTSDWKRFAARLTYAAADATCATSMQELKQQLFPADSQPPANTAPEELIVYLAIPPNIFAPVCKTLDAVNLAGPTTRIVVEKPLGDDRASFLEINRQLTAVFNESQIYRIDHYLGKEAVQNLLALRFANAMFEPLWNQKYIDHVQITVAETVGAQGRWAFYDAAGALRDMIQNHLLQLLCLTAMEPPATMQADDVRDEKLKVLRCLKPMDASKVRRQSVRGQYAAGAIAGQPVAGYLQEPDAGPTSTTETFVALKTEIDNWRWAGVPFYLRTGKRLPMRFSEIFIQFKEVPHSIFGRAEADAPNSLKIRLQPDDSIQLNLMNKVPGLDTRLPLQSVALDLSFSEVFHDHLSADAYERLLLDVIRANPTLFMRTDEVEAAWTWVDGIRAGWQTSGQRVSAYSAGTWGPSEAIGMLAKDDRHWDGID